MALRGTFSSAFTRRSCNHEKVFHSEYQRTNRTKENKILRCFPHCCPEHVRRSYCGSSLHVQVDFHASSLPSAVFSKPTRDDDLLVFGRFRPRESRGFRVGDRIAGAAILSSLQSEDNPRGEWIEAWLIAAADQNTWLYEVNNAARWYYNWGSSAAKDKRLKEHVFEVYVLYQSSGPVFTAEEERVDGRQTAADSFQVAAVSCSPPFKVLSFRRAPTSTRQSGHADAERSSLSEEEIASRGPSDGGRDRNAEETGVGRATPPPARLGGPALPRYLKPHHVYYREDGQQQQRQQQQHADRGRSGAALPHDWRTPPPTHHGVSFNQLNGSTAPAFATSTARLSSAGAPFHYPSGPFSSSIISTGKRSRGESSASQPFLHSRISNDHNRGFRSSSFSPLQALPSPSPWRDFARLETRSPSPSLRLTPPPVFHSGLHSMPRRHSQMEDVAQVLAFLRTLPLADVTTAVGSLETTFRLYATRLTGANNLHESPLAATATHDTVERLLSKLGEHHQAPSHRRLPPELVDVAARLSLWLECDPDLAHARTPFYEEATASLLHKPTLMDMFERFVGWLHTQIEGFLRQRRWSFEAFLVEIRADTSVHDDAHGTGAAFADFVAQVREQFLLDRPQQPKQHGLSLTTPSASRLSGVWRSGLGAMRVHRIGRVDGEAIPLDALLWFWKQLSCVSISLDTTSSSSSSSSTTLEMRSPWNSDQHTGLQLVLDGRPRWFRAFPCGTSTSARNVGTQSFGDYRAVYDTATDSIECVMYSWPTTPGGEDHEDVSTAHAYCWRWQLTPSTGPHVPGLRVQLIVTRGTPSSLQSLTMEPLARKCERVETWDRVALADWTMEA